MSAGARGEGERAVQSRPLREQGGPAVGDAAVTVMARSSAKGSSGTSTSSRPSPSSSTPPPVPVRSAGEQGGEEGEAVRDGAGARVGVEDEGEGAESDAEFLGGLAAKGGRVVRVEQSRGCLEPTEHLPHKGTRVTDSGRIVQRPDSGRPMAGVPSAGLRGHNARLGLLYPE